MKLALFDFDGLIIDSESASFEAWRRVFAAKGVTLSRRHWLFFVGSATRSPVRLLALVTKTDCTACQSQKDQILADLCSHEPARPGVAQTLQELTAQGVECRIVSNGSSHWVGGHLERLSLAPYFSVLHCGDSRAPVTKDTLYRRAVETVGAGRSIVAVEDSLAGARAAHTNGLSVLVYPNAVTCGQDFSDFPRVLPFNQPLCSGAVLDVMRRLA